MIAKRTCILHRIRHMVDFLRIPFWMASKENVYIGLACMGACFLEPFACESALPKIRIDMRDTSIHHISNSPEHRYLITKGFPCKGLMLFNSHGISRRGQSSRYV